MKMSIIGLLALGSISVFAAETEIKGKNCVVVSEANDVNYKRLEKYAKKKNLTLINGEVQYLPPNFKFDYQIVRSISDEENYTNILGTEKYKWDLYYDVLDSAGTLLKRTKVRTYRNRIGYYTQVFGSPAEQVVVKKSLEAIRELCNYR